MTDLDLTALSGDDLMALSQKCQDERARRMTGPDLLVYRKSSLEDRVAMLERKMAALEPTGI